VAIGEKQSGTGSGFFVAPRTFVTNAHVVEGAAPDKIFVVNQVFGKPVQAKLLHVGQRSESGGGDYAVLEVNAPADQPFLSLASSVERLDNVIAGGFPAIILETDMDFQRLRQGDASAAPQMAVTQGVVTVVQKLPGGQSVVSHTATISPGNSGGPLVDSCGRVVGINTLLRADKLRTLYIALHAQSLAQFLGEKGVSFSKRDDRCAPAVVPPVAAAPSEPGAAGSSPAAPPGAPGSPQPAKK
jgi:S1-C subfamily serine protease